MVKSNKGLHVHRGATRLYENPEAPVLYMLSEPDCVRMAKEFEAAQDLSFPYIAHHEEGHSL